MNVHWNIWIADVCKRSFKCTNVLLSLQKPMACNATVYMTDTETDTEQVECHLDDYVVPEKVHCLGCQEEINVNSDDLKVPLSLSISKYNSISNSTHLFTIHDIGHATRQVVAGFRYKVKFDMRKTTCAKDTHKELSELCVIDEADVEFSNCNSTVDVAPWRLEPALVHVECEAGPLPPVVFSKRRPPGWSPLREFLYPTAFATATPSPATSQVPSPSKASAKEEESSEEDINTTASPSAAPEAVNGNRFHCPSKPWKPFHPVNPTVTVTVDVVAIEPTGGKDLSDGDLLA
ncbi:kininogen-1-like [Solea senegalensis]|uniref:Kininogen-1-like n=1 Tax=Solea senegalensis TaxID=28829 RepID=A0AAV6SAM7_SOLSE|nr:kininogen-1-like [Solea senegalensis]